MMHAGRVILVGLAVAASVAALPNHLKAVVVDSDPIPPVKTVSASFGGYSAQAGLGGTGQGPSGGLFAAAQSPLGSAAAGLGGTKVGGQESAGAAVDQGSAASHASAPSTGHKPTAGGHKPATLQQGPGPFDGIFQIPISVLQAVNTYLNNRGTVTKPVHRRRGHRPRPRPSYDDEEVVYKSVTSVKGGSPGVDTPPVGGGDYTPAVGSAASAGSATGDYTPDVGSATSAGSATVSGAAPGPGTQGHVVLQKRVNYDDIFNIPISALKSVNDLLNG